MMGDGVKRWIRRRHGALAAFLAALAVFAFVLAWYQLQRGHTVWGVIDVSAGVVDVFLVWMNLRAIRRWG